MPTTILILLALSVGALFVFDVLLDRPTPGLEHVASEGPGAREFATRVVPIYLTGIGVAMLPLALYTGLGLLAFSAALFLFGRRGGTRQCSVDNCGVDNCGRTSCGGNPFGGRP